MKIINDENFKIIIGQNAKENWEIIDNSNNDWYWFHLTSFPSCHVILCSNDITQKNMLLSAEYCKKNSKYKNYSNLKVSYCQVKNIKKGDDIGSVHFISNRKVKQIKV